MLADLLDWCGLHGCHFGAADSTVSLCTRILCRSLALGLSTTFLGSLQADVFLSSCFALGIHLLDLLPHRFNGAYTDMQ